MKQAETNPRRRGRRWLINTTLFIVSISFVLFFLEIILRGQEPDMNSSVDGTAYAVHAPPEMIDAFTWDGEGNSLAHVRSANPVLVFELRPGTQLNEFIKINSQGFRDHEYSIEKPPNTFRICVIGDSITFGWWEQLENTYPKVLEGLLNGHAAQPAKFEVWNMGVGGYNAEQEAELLRTRVLKLDPDLVIIGYCSNDHYVGADAGLWRHFTRSGSFAWDWISLRWMQVREIFRREEILQRSYRRIAEIAEEAKIPVMVVFFYPKDEISDILKMLKRDVALAKELGFIIVDLRETFESHGWDRTMTDLMHPNVLGHRIAAVAIYEKLNKTGLIPGLPVKDN